MKVCSKLIWNMLLLLHNVNVSPDIQRCLGIKYQISVIFRIWPHYLSCIRVVSFEQTAVKTLTFCLRGLFPANRFLFTPLILKRCVHFKNIQDKILLAFPNNQQFETSSYRPSLACLKNCSLSEPYFSCGLPNLLVARALHPSTLQVLLPTGESPISPTSPSK